MSSSKSRRRKRLKTEQRLAGAIGAPESALKMRWLWEGGLVLAFFLVCGFDMWHHEMWRDEMQPWLFARDSTSIGNLLSNLHYEAHMRLWYIILFGVARISSNPAAMQITHLLVITSAIALFVRFCPLPYYIKALTVFGYYFVYEWGAMSRNYALGVLLLFAFCAMFPRRDKGYFGLAVILSLAIQANHYPAVLAMAFTGFLIFEAWMRREVWDRIREHKVDAALSLLLVIASLYLAFSHGIPQSDATQRGFSFSQDLWGKTQHAFTAVWDGFVPIPEPTLMGSWGWGMTGHSLLGTAPVFHAILGMILFPVTVMFFWRSRLVRWGYLGGAGLLLLVSFAKFDNYARHTGHFFLWFLMCLWLAYYYPDESVPSKIRPFKILLYQKLFLCPLLLFYIFDSAYVSLGDYEYQFSCSKITAEYLEVHHLDTLPIFGYPDYTSIPVSGYLDRQIYYPDTHRWGSFVIENNKRRPNVSQDELLGWIDDFAARGNQDFIVLLGRPITATRDGQVFIVRRMGNLFEEASFYPCMQGDEIYWIYHYKAPAS